MDEYFLHFLWMFQKFEHLPLRLSDERELAVFHTGHQNKDSGPDFKEAKLKIDGLIWSGSVEIHYKSSDWQKHKHEADQAYENVILHVVWSHDQEVKIGDSPIPTLELKHFVSTNLEKEYRKYINQPEDILCGGHLKHLPGIQLHQMMDAALTDRLEEKSKLILKTLKETNADWEETTYRTIAKNFGFKVNSDSFEILTKTLPYQIIRKQGGNSLKIFALIFGMSGFLADPQDEYSSQLAEEFHFLSKKHNLSPQLERFHWKFAKLRPANFPTVRLAQFAAFLSANDLLFSKLIALSGYNEIRKFMQCEMPDYWMNHYDFEKTSTKNQKIGKSSMEIVMINSLVPLLFAYARYAGEEHLIDRALQILEEIPTESNYIIKKWNDLGVSPKNATDSQALLHQYRNYCLKKKCLNCNIGVWILNRP